MGAASVDRFGKLALRGLSASLDLMDRFPPMVAEGAPAVLHLGGTRTAEPPHPQTATPTFSRRIITTKQKLFVVRDQAFGDDRGACLASPSYGFSC